MPANDPAQPEDLTMSEVATALELSALDPDAPHTPKMKNCLRAARYGATVGLEWGAPVPLQVQSIVPESALEAGSVSHAGFDH